METTLKSWFQAMTSVNPTIGFLILLVIGMYVWFVLVRNIPYIFWGFLGTLAGTWVTCMLVSYVRSVIPHELPQISRGWTVGIIVIIVVPMVIIGILIVWALSAKQANRNGPPGQTVPNPQTATTSWWQGAKTKLSWFASENWKIRGLILLTYVVLHICLWQIYPEVFKNFWKVDNIWWLHGLAIAGVIAMYWGSSPTHKPVHWMGATILALVLFAFLSGLWKQYGAKLASSGTAVQVGATTTSISDVWNGRRKITVVAPVDQWSEEVPVPFGKKFILYRTETVFIAKNGAPVRGGDGKEFPFTAEDINKLGSDVRKMAFKATSNSPVAVTISFENAN